VESSQSRETLRDGSFHLELVLRDDIGELNGMSHHICTELEGEKVKEKRSWLQVYNLLSASCNTNYNKFGERIREER